jgi:hypothetical protein
MPLLQGTPPIRTMYSRTVEALSQSSFFYFRLTFAGHNISPFIHMQRSASLPPCWTATKSLSSLSSASSSYAAVSTAMVPRFGAGLLGPKFVMPADLKFREEYCLACRKKTPGRQHRPRRLALMTRTNTHMRALLSLAPQRHYEGDSRADCVGLLYACGC